MKAMIFAAGMGTRLKPLTDNCPKALIKMNGKSLLEHAILKLKNAGINEIIINVHYLANQILEFLNANQNFGLRIEISDEQSQLLDTGGGLKKASWFFNNQQDFIVYNVDIISNIDLNLMLSIHKAKKALATLAIRERISSRYLLFNDEFQLSGWKKNDLEIISNPNKNLNAFAFSGIHIINPNLFNFIQTNGTFSIVETYLELSKQHLIFGYKHFDDYWFDIGTAQKLTEAEIYLENQKDI